MLFLSDKSLKMPASPIRKLVPYSDKAKQKGKKVYHLNIGQPDIESPRGALKGLREFSSELLAYTPSVGTLDYRKALSDYFNNRGIDINPSNVIATLGGSEALRFVFGIIANAGDEIIVAEPFYANYIGFSTENDINIISIPTYIEDNFALPSIDKFAAKITEKTRAIVICNPGNPTGNVYNNDELLKLKKLVLDNNIYLISDEVYAEYLYTDKKFTSALSIPELEQNVIVIDSESKRFSLCGARCGALITRNEKLIEVATRFAQARLSPVETSQYIATLAHQNVGDYFYKCRQEYRSRRDVLIKELSKIKDVKYSLPKGSFYCMAELPIDNAEKFSIWLLEEFSLDNETVMLAPGAGFYFTEELGRNQVRIAYVLKKEDLIRSVQIIKEGLIQYPGTIR